MGTWGLLRMDWSWGLSQEAPRLCLQVKSLWQHWVTGLDLHSVMLHPKNSLGSWGSERWGYGREMPTRMRRKGPAVPWKRCGRSLSLT